MAPLAIASGDPAGIGPELIVRAWLARIELGLPPFLVTGSPEVLRRAAEALGLDCPVAPVGSAADAEAVFPIALPVLTGMTGPYTPGEPQTGAARLAAKALEVATDLALSGEASALVTGPVAKAQLAAIGFAFPGQTEYLAARCGMEADQAVMMLAGPSLRAVPLTIHLALAEVPARLTRELIVSKGRITATALQRDFGIAVPRLAVTGLNPHAGEGGQFGREEIEIIAPAVVQLRSEGIAVRGRTGFDAALCMYHDQALIPVKALDFDQGVNVTLGLPIIRTSPDHGTAFDIAGQGLADPGAIIAAIRMAGECAMRRFQSPGA
jgi:4-hydroxythreonine-4-phosphate dehydrogenase